MQYGGSTWQQIGEAQGHMPLSAYLPKKIILLLFCIKKKYSLVCWLATNFVQSSSNLAEVIFRPSLTNVIRWNFDFWNCLSNTPNRNWQQSHQTGGEDIWIYTKLGGLIHDPVQRESRIFCLILPCRGAIIKKTNFFVYTFHIFDLKSWLLVEGMPF